MNEITLHHPRVRASRAMRFPSQPATEPRATFFSQQESDEYSDAVSQYEWDDVS